MTKKEEATASPDVMDDDDFQRLLRSSYIEHAVTRASLQVETTDSRASVGNWIMSRISRLSGGDENPTTSAGLSNTNSNNASGMSSIQELEMNNQANIA